jgi:nucleotide-binding universal stress UspA family protein
MNTAQFCPVAKLEKLLLATDRSSFSEGAVRESIDFAKRCSSRLYVMSVMETNPEYETIGAQFYQKEEEEATQYLASLKARAAQDGVSFCETALHYAEEPCQCIVDEAEERNADMVILGRRGRRGLMKVLMGEVAARVVSHAPCKVLVVPRAARIEGRNILVATDGSEHSIAAAAEAIGIAKRCGGTVHVVSSAHSEAELGEAKAHVQQVADMASKEGVPVETVTPIGKTHEAIVETAGGRGVDLIVMGTYGRTGLKRLLMGSSTEKVIGHASCAVLVVKAASAAKGQCAPPGAHA